MEELGQSLPASEGMVDAEHGGKVDDKRPNRLCLNCSTPLTDKYCPHCGQKDIPRRQTIGELIVNFIGSFTSFESKFFKTIRDLLFRPGFLTEEYNAGRRERYYHPARAYVFISFIFFLVFFNLDSSDEDLDKTSSNNTTFTIKTGDDDVQVVSFDTIVDFKSVREYDSIQNTLSPEKRDGWFESTIKRRTIDLNLKYLGRGDQFIKDLLGGFVNSFPKVFFILLPIFALLLKLLYIRRDFYYSEHLVFTIQYYNFFYLAGTISILVGLVSWLEWVQIIIALWIAVYMFLAMKRVYRQSWFKTFAKYALFWCLFGTCIGMAFLIDFLFVILYVM